jgi:hypothetical protein
VAGPATPLPMTMARGMGCSFDRLWTRVSIYESLDSRENTC